LAFGEADLCGECLADLSAPELRINLLSVAPVLAITGHEGAVRRMLVRAKEEAGAPGEVVLKRLLFDLLQTGSVVRGAILAVPPSKYRIWRGHYLAAILAEHLRSKTGWGGGGCFLRRRGWRRQQSGLGGADRRTNLANSFIAFKYFGIPPPRRVWLVDDVCTTGSTLQACATALHEIGVEQVGALVLTRVESLS